MGIPHLITYLAPYAVKDRLSSQDVVVDGPGLAYHIYHKCLCLRSHLQSPLEATPSYTEIGDATIAWLDSLKNAGNTIRKTFFDGYLPPDKKPTRIRRLAASSKQLEDFYRANSDLMIVKIGSSVVRTTTPQLFDHAPLAPKLSKWPAPPFLVPAVIEAILISKDYQDILEVVPGEADSFCAAYVKTYGGTVITGDSDLLVHDTGSRGSVMLFKDMTFESEDNRKFGIYGLRYQTSVLAERLSLSGHQGLLSLALEMSLDHQGTFRQLLQRALMQTSEKSHPALYMRFKKQYEDMSLTDRDSIISSAESRLLDPRISEYVIQVLMIAGESLPSRDGQTKPGQGDIDIFLPFICDCPIRTSAWESTTRVRLVAYGLLTLIAPKLNGRFVVEHRRNQTSLKQAYRGRRLGLPSIEQTIEECSRLVDGIAKALKQTPSSVGLAPWRLIAALHEADWSSENGKLSLYEKCGNLAKDGVDLASKPGSVLFDCVHISAQFQGCYYSYRILKQLLEFVSTRVCLEEVSVALSDFQQQLRILPLLRDMQCPVDCIHNYTTHESLEIFSTAEIAQKRSLSDGRFDEKPPEGSTAGKAPQHKRQRRHRKAASKLFSMEDSSKSNKNMYSMLEEE